MATVPAVCFWFGDYEDMPSSWIIVGDLVSFEVLRISLKYNQASAISHCAQCSKEAAHLISAPGTRHGLCAASIDCREVLVAKGGRHSLLAVGAYY
jgi:hypothetical protein